jgi:hypothetical protein
LEETREGRAVQLGRAVEAIEEAVRLYGELGLQAELASSLNNASGCYSDLAGLEETREGRIAWLRKALECIEGAVERFRAAGIVRYPILALHEDVLCDLRLADATGELDRDRVLALCREGEPLCAAMGDQQRLAFFHGVREALERRD